MKKLILALAAVALLGTAAQAQKINKEALLQKIEKNETASADAKKGAKAATWLNLGKSYVEAILAPTKDLYVGELGLQLDMTFGSPKSIDEVTINGMSVAAQNYDYLTVYVSNGQVIGWKEIEPVKEGAIDKAIAALNKAYELDSKQGPKVKRTYSKSSGKLILKNGDDTLTAYVGKRTYYLNGVKKTFSVAPTKVKYYKTKKTIILIPANAIVKGLGLNYKYSSSSKRIYITQPVIPSDSTTQVQTQPSGSVQYTNYNKSLSAYVTAEKKQHPTYGGKSISTSTYTSYIDPSKDTTNNFQFLTLDTYREVDPTAYNNLLNSKLRSNSVLRNKGNVLIAAAKQYNIDPVYLLCQTILETGYGTSTLSQGKAITTVVSGSSVVRDSSGNVTGFKTVNGKYITSTISKKMVYNLYGIKAYDSNPQLCGFSYAYYQGWTSVDAAIYGAAKYVSQDYIHNQTYQQNTLYKFRYNPNINYLWHEYATDPSYAKQIATIMYS
ncbi:glucosaminidase domain-containing protein, partial [Alistipes sp.]|uniref:N-acetylglucosaminidase n=1 Tax=Alistipes sp. TaxID=1872444 RepID=UPI0023F3FE94